MPISLTKTQAPEIERVDISHLRDAVTDLDTVRAHLSALKEEETQLLAAIKEAIGTAKIGTIDGEDAVRLDERTNTSLDKNAVKALLSEEAFASVLRLTPYVATVVVGKFKQSRR